MPVVSITRLRVRSWRYLPSFFIQTVRIAFQARQANGNLAVRLLRDRQTYWTITIWSSDAAVKAFMHAAPHGPAMRSLLEWCDEASLARWTQDAELPSWDEAHARLEREGRPSKVNHPSAAHAVHRFPAPTARRTGQLRLKG
jgi:hypothetical protein